MDFFLGVCTGIVGTLAVVIIYANYKISKHKKELRKHLNDFMQLGERYKALQEEIRKNSSNTNKVSDITPQQERVLESKLHKLEDISQRLNTINLACQQPSKNQMHSLYKNSLIREARELADQRDKLLQELWDSGHNPLIKTCDSHGNVRNEYLRDLLADAMGKNEPEEKKEEEKKSHLRLIKDEE
jgi:anion-transporting  ArsA/GET3 family ATPase